jgi:hypothetical protein
LAAFSAEEKETICLFRLGGLVDAGALEPLIPKPEARLDDASWLVWHNRIPIRQHDVAVPELWPVKLPPSDAAEMLRFLRGRVPAQVARDKGAPPPVKLPETVVLWEGAAHTKQNIRLARTRTAYLEAHGNVAAAMAAMAKAGHRIGRSTLYDHLKALDTECPGWRANVLASGASGNPEDGVNVRTRGESRAKTR